MISQDVGQELSIAEQASRPVGRRPWAIFILAGALLYLLIYGGSEYLVYQHGLRSRLFMIPTAPKANYDFVILGASHALPFGFEDMNTRLETMTGSSFINLAVEGGGVVPARFFLDYFLAHHTTRNVVYILDSFAFYSRQWNEERIDDPKLLKRAPFDPALLSLLWRYKSTRSLIPGYVSGFYKINNADRFDPDISDTERNDFGRVYRANAYLDKQRIAYLYPKTIDQPLYEGYLAQFDRLAAMLHDRGINLIVVRTPLPDRVLKNLQGEDEFDARIQKILAAYGFAFHDFTHVANDDADFYDTDHLNRAGAVNFIDKYLGDVLKKDGAHKGSTD